MPSAAESTTARSPVTLHGVLRDAVGQGLHACYRVDEEIPHSLLVVLMQMNEEQRREAAAAA